MFISPVLFLKLININAVDSIIDSLICTYIITLHTIM